MTDLSGYPAQNIVKVKDLRFFGFLRNPQNDKNPSHSYGCGDPVHIPELLLLQE